MPAALDVDRWLSELDRRLADLDQAGSGLLAALTDGTGDPPGRVRDWRTPFRASVARIAVLEPELRQLSKAVPVEASAMALPIAKACSQLRHVITSARLALLGLPHRLPFQLERAAAAFRVVARAARECHRG
jgi:hypothetical protein